MFVVCVPFVFRLVFGLRRHLSAGLEDGVLSGVVSLPRVLACSLSLVCRCSRGPGGLVVIPGGTVIMFAGCKGFVAASRELSMLVRTSVRRCVAALGCGGACVHQSPCPWFRSMFLSRLDGEQECGEVSVFGGR